MCHFKPTLKPSVPQALLSISNKQYRWCLPRRLHTQLTCGGTNQVHSDVVIASHISHELDGKFVSPA